MNSKKLVKYLLFSCVAGSLLLLAIWIKGQVDANTGRLALPKLKPVFVYRTSFPDLDGIYIGYGEDGVDFCRLDLRKGPDGFCILQHDRDIRLYKTHCQITDGRNVAITLNPLDNNEEMIHLSGRVGGSERMLELDLERGKTNMRFHLLEESHLLSSDASAKRRIEEFENK